MPMSPEKEMKFVPWTWIVSILMGLLMLVGGYLLNDTRAQICDIQKEKLSRNEYIKDYQARNEATRGINDKLDDLRDLIIKSKLK